MAGQVRRQHGEAAMREPSRQQRPDRVIERGAVHEENERQREVEIASAGGGKRLRTVDDELHPLRPLRGAQRLRQIVDDIARPVDADREPHQLLA